MMIIQKMKFISIAFFLFTSSISLGFDTALEKKNALDKHFELVTKSAHTQRELTGGLMLSLGATLILGGLGATLIGSDYALTHMPPILAIPGALLTIGGLYVLIQPSKYESDGDDYLESRDWKLEEYQNKSAFGEKIYGTLKGQAKCERILGTAAMILAGATNIYFSGQMGQQDINSKITGSGYAMTSIGILGLSIDKHLWGVGSIFGLGMHNLILTSAAPEPASKDFYLYSGSLYVAMGIGRIFVKKSAENELELIANGSFNLTPIHQGLAIAYQTSF